MGDYMMNKRDEHDDEAFGFTDQLVNDVIAAVNESNSDKIRDALDPQHPADIAHLIEQLDARRRAKLFELWPECLDGEVLSELNDSLREDLIETFEPRQLANALKDLETDDVVEIYEDLDDDRQKAVLETLDVSERLAVEIALSCPEHSAGRHMQAELVRVPELWTVGATIDFLRSGPELPEQFYHIMLVTPHMKVIGYVSLGRVLSAKRETLMKNLTEENFRTFNVHQDVEEVAQAINHYHMITAPLVDDDERLIGVMTIDDAMIFLEEETEEDIMRLAGAGDGSISDSILETTKQRFPWLAVNLVTAICASLVISVFEQTIEAIVALAILMPIVASMGGNAGTQTLTVAVRALATRDLTSANMLRVLRREVFVGVLNGAVFAVLMGVIGFLWFDSLILGYVIGASMVFNLLIAGFAGVLVPVILERFKIDPALASGAFVTTVTDVVGFFAFLGLAGTFLL